MTNPPTIRRITTESPEYTALLALRDEVLRIPLGLSLNQFDFSNDATDIILCAFAEGENETGEMIGCVMGTPKSNGVLKLRQMAVKHGLQRGGVGKALIAVAEETARAAGFQTIILHARFVAIGFYEKLDYRREGSMFDEVGIPHIRMSKALA